MSSHSLRAMSLTFDFPGFHKEWAEASPDKLTSLTSSKATDVSDWAFDLQELSGDEADEAQQQQQIYDPEQTQPHDAAAGTSDGPNRKKHRYDSVSRADSGDQHSDSKRSSGQDVPGAVLLLVVDRLGLRDAMSAACCCTSWHDAIISNNSSTWEQQEKALLGGCAGWATPLSGLEDRWTCHMESRACVRGVVQGCRWVWIGCSCVVLLLMLVFTLDVVCCCVLQVVVGRGPPSRAVGRCCCLPHWAHHPCCTSRPPSAPAR